MRWCRWPGANNYLGLSNHPKVVEAAHKYLDSHGFGMSSVRFICGTQVSDWGVGCSFDECFWFEMRDLVVVSVGLEDIHKKLESTISEFHDTEATILYPSCFDANAGLFEALLTAEDAIISDSNNHASIIDGIRLCKVGKTRMRHLSLCC